MQETTIWRNIHCNVTSEWTETVEVVDELSKHSGLFLGVLPIYCVAGKGREVPVRVLNVCTEPVVIHKRREFGEIHGSNCAGWGGSNTTCKEYQ